MYQPASAVPPIYISFFPDFFPKHLLLADRGTDRVSGLSGGLRCHDCTERSVSSFPIRTRVHRAKTTKQKIRRFREFFATAAGSSEGGPLL